MEGGGVRRGREEGEEGGVVWGGGAVFNLENITSKF